MNRDCVLKVTGLTKKYLVKKQKAVNAVNNISFEAYKGEVLGFLGPNGAGKTTTIKMICSLIKPTEGKIFIEGVDNNKSRSKSLRNISAVFEGNRNIFWRLTVRENLEFFASLKGHNPNKIRDKIQYYIEFFDLKEKKNEAARNLSRGMQQKLSIATAMVSGCNIILLDEPTLGLDVKASYDIRKLLKEIVKEENKTIILTTHDMNVVQDTCDRVIIMNKGKIVAEDKTKNLLRLFSMKKYNFVVEGKISPEQKKEFKMIPYLEIAEKELETEITITLENPQIFYDVTRILGKENSIIKNIENKELNFERVFVKIIGGSEESA